MTRRWQTTTSFTQSTKTGSRRTSMDNERLSLPQYDIPQDIQNAVTVTTLDRLYNWGRRSSVWPLMFGLACCAIEMIAAQASRYDMARFGMEVMRPTPRHADMMLVSGTVTKKMVPAIVRLYNQMPEPKYGVAMGGCASDRMSCALRRARPICCSSLARLPRRWCPRSCACTTRCPSRNMLWRWAPAP